MPSLSQSSSHSFDYFDDDPEFLKAISEFNLPGDALPTVRPAEDEDGLPTQLKRKRSSPLDIGTPLEPLYALDANRDDASYLNTNTERGLEYHSALNAVDADQDDASYLNEFTYGASRFGEFGEYMSRKRAKLQIQNVEMDGDDEVDQPRSKIFQGLQIYINGWTDPSVQDLRKLIVRHGGEFHAYLDRKSLVTHIITCSLTPAKVREFQHMKVVKPDWLVESIKFGCLLPWQDFIFRPGERAEEAQGRKVGQKSLFDNFVSQASGPAAHVSTPVAPVRSGSPMLIEDEDPSQPCAGPSNSINLTTPPRTPSKFSSSPRKSFLSTPSQSLYTTDPSCLEQASRVPGYAAHESNPNAERAMADPAWRAAHTSAAPDFIEGYYKNSRLHHLSTWKAELKNLVAEAQNWAEHSSAEVRKTMTGNQRDDGGGSSASQMAVDRIMQENVDGGGDVSMRGAKFVRRAPATGKGKGKEKERVVDEERVIMHCDFDSFFVSAGLVDRPHLRGKPVVVCHSQGGTGGASSTSEIASASYEAREFGIKSGMSLQQARKLCPAIMTMPYEFQRYKEFSLQFYTILMAHADDLQAVSVDEALIDVTSSIARIRTELAESGTGVSCDPAKDFAEAIRERVKKVTGCEVSIGIAENIMLARLASRRAKPAGSFHLRAEDVSEFIAPLNIDNLHGFGHATRQKAEEKLGTTNLGELSKRSKATLFEALGKGTGETLYKALRGIDERQLESDKPRKSVSCDINYGIRFDNNEQAESFIHQMAEEVSRRLAGIGMRGRSLTLKIMVRDPSAPVEAPKFLGHGMCDTYNKQVPLIAPGGRATSDDKVIGEHAWRALKSFNFDPKELRGVAIQIQKLEKASGVQDAELGQALLPFKRVATGKRAEANAPTISVQPPSQNSDVDSDNIDKPRASVGDGLDLPSFSQVDMSVFEALPDDVRKELEAEYQRRSVTPGPSPKDPPIPDTPPEPEAKKSSLAIKGVNVKRITQQLAPRNRPILSPKKNLFAKRVYASSINVSERELRKYGIDPEVFAALPQEMQREQLAARRTTAVTLYTTERKVLKPKRRRSSKSPSNVFRPPPAPKAVFVEGPTLKQQGKVKGEKLHFSEKEDLQGVVETWVESFRDHAPNRRDVDYFAKFLVQSVDGARSSDIGVEKAVAVVKWWVVLLRRYFGVWEHADKMEAEEMAGMSRGTSEYVGRAWWTAFREVKGQMDVAARRKFGGCLSLK